MKSITLNKIMPYEVQLPFYAYDSESKSHYRVDEVAHIFDRYEVTTITPNSMVRISSAVMGTDEISKLIDGCTGSTEETFVDALDLVYRSVYKQIGKEFQAA